MDERPIGVFDSGLGGLTTVKKLLQLLPGEDIIYLGDTGRVPYGSRSRETIIRYARQDAAFLAGFNIKAMIIACNTVCASAYEEISAEFNMPVFEVVKTPASAAVQATKNGKIGVIGTSATIGSGAYEKAIASFNSDVQVFTEACPLFVPLVENGRTEPTDIVAVTVVSEYLRKILGDGIDTLILGCTHYPLLRGVISFVAGSGVRLIDSGAETAYFAAAELEKSGLLTIEKAGSVRYFVTDSTAAFSETASRFLESDVTGSVKRISLD